MQSGADRVVDVAGGIVETQVDTVRKQRLQTLPRQPLRTTPRGVIIKLRDTT
jgi:hypothetical protein